jgi:hypothetical protein
MIRSVVPSGLSPTPLIINNNDSLQWFLSVEISITVKFAMLHLWFCL